MPSKTMDHRGLSSSSFFASSTSGDVAFPTERQVGFWKSETRPDHNAIGKSVGSLAHEKLVEFQSAKSLGHPQLFQMNNRKTSHGLDKLAVGAERTPSHSLASLNSLDCDSVIKSVSKIMPTSYFPEAGNVNMTGPQYESSLFSSSLSDLFSRKLRLSANNAVYGQSIGTVASHVEEEEPFESLEEIEAQTIGNLLPRDEDLFTGVTDGTSKIKPSTGVDDVEELDLFSSVGGMDLGNDGSPSRDDSEFPEGVSNRNPGLCNGSMAGEHPYGENPSRTLFVRNINSNVEDSELRALFEQYGDIRTLYTACKHRGFVMISYYDIRAARNAMEALQNRPLRRRKLDIHYSIPKDNPSENDFNQGTLTIFNLDSSVSNDELQQIFCVYGDIKEIRETLHESNHKYIEYYDIRAAEAALQALNRINIAGKQIQIEPTHPVDSRRFMQKVPSELEQDERRLYVGHSSSPNNSTIGYSGLHGAVMGSSMENGTILSVSSPRQAPFLESAFHHGVSSSVPNGLPSLLRMESAVKQAGLAEPRHLQGLKFDLRGTPDCHPHSLPEYQDGISGSVHCPSSIAANINLKPPERIDSGQLGRGSANGHSIELNDGIFGSAGKGSCSLPGHCYAWGNPVHPEHSNFLWPNSPSFGNGISMAHPSARLHGPLRAPPQMLTPVLPMSNHHVGSAPTNPSFWDRRHSYIVDSPDASGFHPGSLGSMRISNNLLHSVELISQKVFPNVAGNCMDLPISPKNIGLQSHQRPTIFPGRAQLIPSINSFDPASERARSRRNEGSINQADKKLYELDVDRIMRGEDNRTTLMIKNIPNKYTSKMLLAAIDEHHKGTYNFIYLPIDFKNKCNVGYAFINMIDAGQIIPFYQSFNGKKWEKFNSEKVATLAYARIQGKAALITHFQNSSLMNEDKRCRPILFSTDGPNAGDQVPFPTGVSIRSRPGKPRTFSHDENQQGNLPGLANGEDCSNGDASAVSGKESD